MKEIIDNSTNKKEHAPTLYPAEQSKNSKSSTLNPLNKYAIINIYIYQHLISSHYAPTKRVTATSPNPPVHCTCHNFIQEPFLHIVMGGELLHLSQLLIHQMFQIPGKPIHLVMSSIRGLFFFGGWRGLGGLGVRGYCDQHELGSGGPRLDHR